MNRQVVESRETLSHESELLLPQVRLGWIPHADENRVERELVGVYLAITVQYVRDSSYRTIGP